MEHKFFSQAGGPGQPEGGVQPPLRRLNQAIHINLDNYELKIRVLMNYLQLLRTTK